MATDVQQITPEQLQAVTKAALQNLNTVMNQLDSCNAPRFDVALDCLDQAKTELETVVGEGQ